MKKMHIFKALFAATALALALPSCSDIGEESLIQPQTIQAEREGKIAVSLSVREEFRTIISAVDTGDLAYTLVITDTAESTAADYEASKTVELTDLTGTVAYLTPEKTYSFALTGYAKDTDGKATTTAILATRSPVQKKITATSATVSLVLQAVTTATVQVTLPVTYGTGYGISDVTATVYDDSALATSSTDTLTLDSENAKNTDKTDGEVVFTGTIATGATKWVKIELKDGTKIIGGKTVALYGIPTGDIEAESVEATVKEYKATVNLTADTKPESLTLKNPAVTTAGYTGISVATESTTNPYVFTAYVPVGTYDVYNGETLLGQVATSAAPLTVNTSITLTKITAAWTTSQPTLYVGGEGNEDAIKAALTVTATLSTGDEAVTNYTLNFDNTTAGEQTATISYTYNGKTETATVTLTLTAVALESIAVDGEASAKETDGEGNARTPLKLTYTTNDTSIDLTGLVLKLTNNDGSTSSVAYSGDNITKTGYFEDNSGVPGTVIADEATIFASAHTCWVQVTYSEKTATFKVTVKQGVTYIKEGKYNLTTSAKAGYTVDGNENGKWDAQAYDQNNNPTQTHDGITITGAVTSNGFDSHGKNSPGTITFALNSAMYLTFADSNNKGVTIKSTDGGSVDGTTGGKDTVVGASSKPSTFLLTAGNYTMASTTAGSTRIATLEFNSLATTWANAKASVGTAPEYWTGWDAISTALSATPSTDDEYLAAISALQEAIATAVKYVAPTAITVTYGGTTVVPADGVSESYYNLTGNAITFVSSEDSETVAETLTWQLSDATGCFENAAISAGVITGITGAGTATVTVSDATVRVKDSETGKYTSETTTISTSFVLTITEATVHLVETDVVTATATADGLKVSLSAIVKHAGETSAATDFTEDLVYQWYTAANATATTGTEIAGATTASYEYTAPGAGTYYFLVKVTSASNATGITGNTGSIKLVVIETHTITWAIPASNSLTGTSTLTGLTVKAVSAFKSKAATTWSDNSNKFKYEGDTSYTSVAVFSTDLKSTAADCISAGSYAEVSVENNTTNSITLSSLAYTHSIQDKNNGYGCQVYYYIGESTTGTPLTTSAYGNTSAILTKANVAFDENIVVPAGSKVTLRFAYYGGNNGGKNCALKDIVLTVKCESSPASTDPDPNTTVSVDSGISSDITLTADANVFTVAGAPVTASDSTIAWLVDGVAVEGETAATFTLTGKTVGEWYDVTAKVTDAGGVVYTKTTSVLYTGN